MAWGVAGAGTGERTGSLVTLVRRAFLLGAPDFQEESWASEGGQRGLSSSPPCCLLACSSRQ